MLNAPGGALVRVGFSPFWVKVIFEKEMIINAFSGHYLSYICLFVCVCVFIFCIPTQNAQACYAHKIAKGFHFAPNLAMDDISTQKFSLV